MFNQTLCSVTNLLCLLVGGVHFGEEVGSQFVLQDKQTNTVTQRILGNVYLT